MRKREIKTDILKMRTTPSMKNNVEHIAEIEGKSAAKVMEDAFKLYMKVNNYITDVKLNAVEAA